MRLLILFPSDYFDYKLVEDDYAIEYEAANQVTEMNSILWNYDGFISGEPVKIYPKDYYKEYYTGEHHTGDCIYRGWMLKPDQYRILYTTLRNAGINLINTPEEYETCHIFPNIKDILGKHTPKSLCFKLGDPIDWELVNKSFKQFMVKDYVKSVKGHKFPPYFDTPVEVYEMNHHLSKFMELRGDLFTGGFVFKDYVDLKKYGTVTNEYRAFYLKGQLLSLCRNSNQSDTVNADAV